MSLIDYVWYVGERFHQREQSPGDGNMLIAICWYCTFFLPLVSVVNKLNISLVLQLLGSIILIVVPFVFCHVRYNQKNKYLIGLQYKNKKHWGTPLAYNMEFLACYSHNGVYCYDKNWILAYWSLTIGFTY